MAVLSAQAQTDGFLCSLNAAVTGAALPLAAT